LQKYHTIGVSDVPATKDPQGTDGDGDYLGIMREQLDDPRREDNKDDSTEPRKAIFQKPVRHTALRARSGRCAPRFCPTRVAAALLNPRKVKIAKMTMRMLIV